MDVRGSLIEAIQKALLELTLDLSFDEIKLERPANPDHGDWSTNVALDIIKLRDYNHYGVIIYYLLFRVP